MRSGGDPTIENVNPEFLRAFSQSIDLIFGQNPFCLQGGDQLDDEGKRLHPPIDQLRHTFGVICIVPIHVVHHESVSRTSPSPIRRPTPPSHDVRRPLGCAAVATFLVTVEDLGSRATREIDAANYFTGEDWVTFWSGGRSSLPEPVARFPREIVVEITEKSD
jgi:hypothetical protein